MLRHENLARDPWHGLGGPAAFGCLDKLQVAASQVEMVATAVDNTVAGFSAHYEPCQGRGRTLAGLIGRAASLCRR